MCWCRDPRICLSWSELLLDTVDACMQFRLVTFVNYYPVTMMAAILNHKRTFYLFCGSYSICGATGVALLDFEWCLFRPTSKVDPARVCDVISGWSRISQRGSANLWPWTKNILFGKIFAENWMKMKEIGPRGEARISLAPPSPLGSTNSHLPMSLHVKYLHDVIFRKFPCLHPHSRKLKHLVHQHPCF